MPTSRWPRRQPTVTSQTTYYPSQRSNIETSGLSPFPPRLSWPPCVPTNQPELEPEPEESEPEPETRSLPRSKKRRRRGMKTALKPPGWTRLRRGGKHPRRTWVQLFCLPSTPFACFLTMPLGSKLPEWCSPFQARTRADRSQSSRRWTGLIGVRGVPSARSSMQDSDLSVQTWFSCSRSSPWTEQQGKWLSWGVL